MKTLMLILANAVLVAAFLACVALSVDLALAMNPFAAVMALWAVLCGNGIAVVQEMLCEDEMESELND